jgi:hypothetical protein
MMAKSAGKVKIPRAGRDDRLLVERAADADAPAIEDMRIDHCRADIPVSQQFLDRTDVRARFEEVRGESVAERMRRGRLRDAGFAHGPLEGALQRFLMQVMASHDT